MSGIIGLSLEETDHGVVVVAIVADPARKAGFQIGDKVLTVDSYPLDNLEDMAVVFARVTPGKKLSFVVERKGQKVSMALIVGDLPPTPKVAKVPPRTKASAKSSKPPGSSAAAGARQRMVASQSPTIIRQIRGEVDKFEQEEAEEKELQKQQLEQQRLADEHTKEAKREQQRLEQLRKEQEKRDKRHAKEQERLAKHQQQEEKQRKGSLTGSITSKPDAGDLAVLRAPAAPDSPSAVSVEASPTAGAKPKKQHHVTSSGSWWSFSFRPRLTEVVPDAADADSTTVSPRASQAAPGTASTGPRKVPAPNGNDKGSGGSGVSFGGWGISSRISQRDGKVRYYCTECGAHAPVQTAAFCIGCGVKFIE